MGFVGNIIDRFRGRDTDVIARQPVKSGYMRDNRGAVFSKWNPPLRRSADDVRLSWQQASARAMDLIQNSGFIAGIVEQAVANTVGSGLKLSLKPDAEFLGWTEDEAAEWSGRVEARFNAWGRRPIDCDAGARLTFGMSQAQAFKHWMAFGEIFATSPYFQRQGGAAETKFRLIPAYMVTNKSDGNRWIHGVQVDDHLAPIAFSVRQKSKNGVEQETVIPARDALGRSVLIHCIGIGDVGMVRGITPFVPVLKVSRQYDQLADATLTAATIQAVFAAVLESDLPTREAMMALQSPSEVAGQKSLLETWLDGSQGWNEHIDIDLGVPGRIAHAFPGEKLKFLASEHPNGQFVDFAKFLLHELARCAGLTYESATGDNSGATYSSVRMSTTEIFEVTTKRRNEVVAPYCQSVFENWLEEDIEKGRTPFPDGVMGFLKNKAAACNATWRGSGKPQADDLKTAKAQEILYSLGVRSQTDIAAENGRDIEDVWKERAREKAARKRYGLDEPVVTRDPSADAAAMQGDNQNG